MEYDLAPEQPPPRFFLKDTVFLGVDKKITCAEVDGQVYEITGSFVRTARLEDEWFEDIDDVYEARHCPADLLTFWQRPPHSVPLHTFHCEVEDVAVLPITTYSEWFTKQVDPKSRNKVRRAEKAGVTVRVCEFDDEYVRGMVSLFNEEESRQGRRFWHYGKDFATVKRQFSRYLHRETVIRADLNGELIGFLMLSWAGEFALIGQIMGSVHHREKGVTNAMIAKAVEICADRGVDLCYYYWDDASSLTAFKKGSGFRKMQLPRYYVPLTWRGRLALMLGLHRGLRALIPPRIKEPLKRFRAWWHS